MGKCAATKTWSEGFITHNIRGLINANNVSVSHFHTNAPHALREFVKCRSSTQRFLSHGVMPILLNLLLILFCLTIVLRKR